MSEGANLIRIERIRLISVGYTEAHLVTQADGELAKSAMAFVDEAMDPGMWPAEVASPPSWPYPTSLWHPAPNAMANLVMAGALIAAELDRLLLAQASA